MSSNVLATLDSFLSHSICSWMEFRQFNTYIDETIKNPQYIYAVHSWYQCVQLCFQWNGGVFGRLFVVNCWVSILYSIFAISFVMCTKMWTFFDANGNFVWNSSQKILGSLVSSSTAVRPFSRFYFLFQLVLNFETRSKWRWWHSDFSFFFWNMKNEI